MYLCFQIKKDDRKYSLASEIEPDEQQLESLMQEVLKDVKKRAMLAEKRLAALQAQQIQALINQGKITIHAK